MATTTTADPNINKEYHDSATHDHAGATNGTNLAATRSYGPYGGNPLAHQNTGESARFAAFGGEFQPGLYRSTEGRKFANPAPLGLSAFALTTFVLSLINIEVRGVAIPQIVISVAFGYGGLVQLLAGMWEMAVGNTFGATALSSYGGFWISFAILLTPGGFEIVQSYTAATSTSNVDYAIGFFLFGWFIFTTMLLVCTLRSTVAFFLLFFNLDLAFLFLATAKFYTGATGLNLQKAGGYFGLFAAFLAWYNALAGIADDSNSFFLIPVLHFPWSVRGRENRLAAKTERETV